MTTGALPLTPSLSAVTAWHTSAEELDALRPDDLRKLVARRISRAMPDDHLGPAPVHPDVVHARKLPYLLNSFPHTSAAVASGAFEPDEIDPGFSYQHESSPRFSGRVLGPDDINVGERILQSAHSSGMVTPEMKITRLGSVLFTLTLAATACGSGAADTTTTTSTTQPAAPQTTSTTSTTSPTTTLPPPPPTTTPSPRAKATTTIIVVQQDLTALGYFSGLIDGIAGDETRAAIAKFQTAANIESDGVFGPQTDAALVLALQADEDYVTKLQEILVEFDFYPGPIDGDYGRGTERGVKRLQESCDLEETGRMDIETRLCLGGHI